MHYEGEYPPGESEAGGGLEWSVPPEGFRMHLSQKRARHDREAVAERDDTHRVCGLTERIVAGEEHGERTHAEADTPERSRLVAMAEVEGAHASPVSAKATRSPTVTKGLRRPIRSESIPSGSRKQRSANP